jgi:hypothetical protein
MDELAGTFLAALNGILGRRPGPGAADAQAGSGGPASETGGGAAPSASPADADKSRAEAERAAKVERIEAALESTETKLLALVETQLQDLAGDDTGAEARVSAL